MVRKWCSGCSCAHPRKIDGGIDQPVDQVNDGIGDNKDNDDDNDGFIDILDSNPQYAGFSPNDNLIQNNQDKQSSSDSTIAGNKALLLLFTTTIAMGLIFGARRFVKQSQATNDNIKQLVIIEQEEQL